MENKNYEVEVILPYKRKKSSRLAELEEASPVYETMEFKMAGKTIYVPLFLNPLMGTKKIPLAKLAKGSPVVETKEIKGEKGDVFVPLI